MVDSQGEPVAWWFNTKTELVEYGRKTKALYRVGPFESEAEAKRALDIIRGRSAEWVEQEDAED